QPFKGQLNGPLAHHLKQYRIGELTQVVAHQVRVRLGWHGSKRRPCYTRPPAQRSYGRRPFSIVHLSQSGKRFSFIQQHFTPTHEDVSFIIAALIVVGSVLVMSAFACLLPCSLLAEVVWSDCRFPVFVTVLIALPDGLFKPLVAAFYLIHGWLGPVVWVSG